MLRNVGGIVLGIVAGFIALALVNIIGGAIFPTRMAVNLHEPAQIKASFAAFPLQLKLVMLSSWFAAGLAGALAAKRVSGRIWPLWFVAIFFALWAMLNVAVLPMPGWMQACFLALPVVGGVIAHLYGPIGPVRLDEQEVEVDQTYV